MSDQFIPPTEEEKKEFTRLIKISNELGFRNLIPSRFTKYEENFKSATELLAEFKPWILKREKEVNDAKVELAKNATNAQAQGIQALRLRMITTGEELPYYFQHPYNYFTEATDYINTLTTDVLKAERARAVKREAAKKKEQETMTDTELEHYLAGCHGSVGGYRGKVTYWGGVVEKPQAIEDPSGLCEDPTQAVAF